MSNDADCLRFELLPAQSIDARTVAALVSAAFRKYPIVTGDRTSPEGLAEEAGPRGEFLQLSRGANLVGSAMIKPAIDCTEEDERLWASEGHDLETSLYFGLAGVDRAEMNAGIGTRLVAEAAGIARERGYRRILLGTVREFGLVPYYGRFGFTLTSEQAFPAGHWGLSTPHSYCIMVKQL